MHNLKMLQNVMVLWAFDVKILTLLEFWIKIQVLRIEISGILKPSEHVIMCLFLNSGSLTQPHPPPKKNPCRSAPDNFVSYSSL